MGNAALIPIVLPNYNVTNISSANLSLPVGHAAFLLVSPDGSAKYYEWGLYKQDQFTITTNGDGNSSGNGNIRALPIDTPLQFDSSGNVTAASLKGALDQVFGSSGMYKSDTGVAIVTSHVLSTGQELEVENYVASKVTAVNNQQDVYSIRNLDDCLDFVYDAARSAGVTVSTLQNTLVIAAPGAGARTTLEQAGQGYEYFGPNSWHSSTDSSVIYPVRDLANPDFVADVAVQTSTSLKTVFGALYDGMSAASRSLLDNILNGDWSPVYGADGSLRQVTATDGQGNSVTFLTSSGQSYSATAGETVIDASGGNTISGGFGTTIAVLGPSFNGPTTLNVAQATLLLDSGSSAQINGGNNSIVETDASNVQPWSSEKITTAINGAIETQEQVLDAGNQLLKLYDADNHKLAKEVDIDEDANGNITAAQVILNSPIVQAGGSIGDIFGSAIGRAIAGPNQFAQLAAGTVVGAIGTAFGQIIAAGLSVDAADIPVGDIFGSFGLNVSGAGASSIASFLTAEIGTALGVNGYGAQLFDAAAGSYAGSVLNQALQMSFNPAIAAIDWSQAFTQAEIGIGSAFGSILAHQIVQAQTEAGAISGQIFGAIGSLLGASLLSEGAGLLLDIALPGIGSLIGTLLGTVIGDLFGDAPKHPSSIHEAVVLQGQALYSSVFQAVSNSDGGDTTISEQLADGVTTIVNAYLQAVGGIGVSRSQGELIGYQTDIPGTPYIESRPGIPYQYFANANDAVNAAALDAVLNTEAVGGNLFLKRVHAHASYGDLATLSGDLQVAQDYERYLDNRDVINALMAANPNSAFTAGWIATFAEASSLGLTQPGAVDFNGGLVGFLHSVKTAGLAFSPGNVDVLRGSDGSITLEIHVGPATAVPGSLIAFASTVNEIDSATGKTIQLVFADGLAAAGFHGPASTSLVSGSWNSIAAAGQNLWFGHDDAPNRFDDPQAVSTNDILIGGAQNDVIYGGTGWNFIEGGAGDDSLFGGPNADILHGGPGADYLAGGGGNDTYAFNRGDGNDTVFDDYWNAATLGGRVQVDGGSDVLAFGAGISLADLVLQMSGNDLIVGVRDPANPNASLAQLADKITLQNWSNVLNRIEYITFADGTFLDISAGVPSSPALIDSSGATRLVAFGDNYYLDGNTGLGAELQYSGSPVTLGELGATISPLAAELFASEYELVWRNSSNNSYRIWNTDSSGTYLSANNSWLSAGNPLLEWLETGFHQDLNGDGTIGIPNSIVIESAGSTSLVQAGGNFYLFNNTSGAGSEVIYQGAPLTVGQFGVTLLGTEQTATGYEIALRNGASYSVWYTDTSGNIVNGTTPLVQTIEPAFHQDLNGDGIIGLPANTTPIESSGSISLLKAGSNYYLASNSTGTGPELKSQGAAYVAGQFGGEITPVGVEQTATGYKVAWYDSFHQTYAFWNADGSGNFLSTLAFGLPGTSLALEYQENILDQDLNGDGTVGIPNGSVVESAGSTGLVRFDNNYYLLDSSTSIGAELKYQGAAYVAGQLGGEWVLVGVEQTATGYEVAWHDTFHNTYLFWNTDSNGNYLSNMFGATSLSGASPLLESQESILRQDLNGDGIVGLPANTTLIESMGSTSLVQAGANYHLESNGTGSGPEVMYQSAPLTVGQFVWTPIAAEQTSTGYEIALSNPGTGYYTIWYTDTDGNVTYSPTGGILGTDPLLESVETTFHQDLNGDGTIGIPGSVVIESSGSVSLVQVGNTYYYLFNNMTELGPEVMYGSAPLTVGEFAWVPIGGEQTGTGYEIALKYSGLDLYTVWYTDTIANVSYSPIGSVAGASPLLEAMEPSFHQDLNGDGIIGLPAGTTLTESFGSTSLVQVGNNFFLESNSTGAGPELKYLSAAFVAGQLGGEWLPVGVEQTASGYEMAWFDSVHQTYAFWNVDGSGNFVSTFLSAVSGGSPLLKLQESILDQDVNNDGVIGFFAGSTAIETSGSISLVQVSNHYYLEGNSNGAGPELMYQGAPLTVGQFVWTPFAAEQTSTGYEIALKYGSSYAFWYTDTSGNVQSSPAGSVESFEPSFQQDLDGDGVIGFAVHAAGSLELSGTIAASVQFLGATGTLILDNSAQFSGQILSFTGAGTPSTSDQIDLKDINYNSASFSHSFNAATDVLTVSDGTHSAALHFVGSYTAQNFKFTGDGANGTIVYDPPVSSGNSTPSGAQSDTAANASAPSQMPSIDLHDALKAHTAAANELLGGYIGESSSADETSPGGLAIIVPSWLAQHDLHVS